MDNFLYFFLVSGNRAFVIIEGIEVPITFIWKSNAGDTLSPFLGSLGKGHAKT